MTLKKLGLDNVNDGVMTCLAGVTLVAVVLTFFRLPVGFGGFDYFTLGTIAIAVLASWILNVKHRQQVELIGEPGAEKTKKFLSTLARSSVFWTCVTALQSLQFVRRH